MLVSNKARSIPLATETRPENTVFNLRTVRGEDLASYPCAVGLDDLPATAEALEQLLYLPELPPVDVLVRTSGEVRISNFLLWQIAGSKVYFTDKAWPDFDQHQLDNALALLA